MSEFETYEKALLETLYTLKDNLEKLLIVGGWCPWLYAKYLWKIPFGNFPRTTDIDLGVRETGSVKYSPTTYERLARGGFATERLYADEELPVEFIYNKADVQMKVEFITSFEVSDDTLRRFLGSELSCNRIDGFEILLNSPAVKIPLKVRGEVISAWAARPAAFLYHKGISFVARSGEEKRDKDLLYVYYMLRYCPKLEEILREVREFKGTDYFDVFKNNILSYVGDSKGDGYQFLRKYVSKLVEPRKVNEEIGITFQPLIEILK